MIKKAMFILGGAFVALVFSLISFAEETPPPEQTMEDTVVESAPAAAEAVVAPASEPAPAVTEPIAVPAPENPPPASEPVMNEVQNAAEQVNANEQAAPAAAEIVTEPPAETKSEVESTENKVEEKVEEVKPAPVLTVPKVMRRTTAEIQGTMDPDITGKAVLTDTPEGLLVSVKLLNFPQGVRGIHIHEKGSCSGQGEGAGGHFNPDNVKHGFLPNQSLTAAHPGDMGNITVRRDGKGDLRVILPGVTVSEGKYAVANRAIVIHEKEDDFGQPTGNAGSRIGCGVIKLAN